ncbi:general substrate transporter [Alternaria alternata]|nr:general substrate transporter [Alternaria alternata]
MDSKQDIGVDHREDVDHHGQAEEDMRPWYHQPELRKLYLLMPFLFLGSTTLGYDGSLLNGLQTMPAWKEFFHHPTGSRLGLLGAFPGFGGFAVLLFTPYIADMMGRRLGTAIGCLLVIMGSIIQAFPRKDNPDAMFLAGRFIMGMGSNISNATCPLLITEVAHPRHRGRSPRWLVSKNKHSAAKKILTKYHGNGAETDFVNWEYNEISLTLEAEKAASASSGWYELVRTPGNRKRCLLIILTAIFSQCSGNGLVSYYLAAVLQTIGITNSSDQALINGGLTIWCWLVSLGCAFLVDRVGRRTLFLSAGIGMLIAFTIWTACSAVYAQTGNSSAGSAVLAMIFLFYGGKLPSLLSCRILYHLDEPTNAITAAGIAWPGLTVSYTVEILPFNIRAKGLTLCFVFTSLAGIFNQYVNPIGIEALGWKFYIVYVVVLVLECLAIYFLYVETKGPALEEIALLFDGDSANVAGTNLALDQNGGLKELKRGE